MAKLINSQEKRSRITFYVSETEALRLDALKKQARDKDMNICFRDDFKKWLIQQLDQLEKAMKAMLKEKGGTNG